MKNTFANVASLNAALGYYRTSSPDVPPFMKTDLTMDALLVGGWQELLPVEAFTEDSRARFSGNYRVEMLDGGHFVHR